MKTANFLLVAILLVITTSCEKEDDPLFFSSTGVNLSGQVTKPELSNIITFSGIRWIPTNDLQTWQKPGKNIFSAENITVENINTVDEILKLSITRGKVPDPKTAKLVNGWRCAQIQSESGGFGYGEYIFQLEGKNIWKLDRNVVFGLFTYDSDAFQETFHSEIDVEFAKWGNSLSDRLYFSVQPTNNGKEGSDLERYKERYESFSSFFSIVPAISKITVKFIWKPGRIDFICYNGYSTDPSPSEILYHWKFDNNDANPPRRGYDDDGNASNPIKVPTPTPNTKIMLNLWLYDGNDDDKCGDSPTNDEPVTVSIKKIKYNAFKPIFNVPVYGLVGYYPFNGNTFDESGNGNNGINYGVQFTQDRFGVSNSAGLFNGTNNYVSIPHNSSFNFGTGNFSIFASVKTDIVPTFSWHKIISKHNLECWHDTEFFMGIEGGTGRAFFGLSTSSGIFERIFSTTSICDNVYHALCGVKNNGTIKFYIDGELVGSLNSMINPDNSNPINIGRSSYYGGQGYFPGVIDDVLIYNRALTEEEIASLH
ncbi:MAG: hypothetical protein HPY62_05135 [Bacteroidales bacterium]|nr:hypothetical protein [Bacteroidales bacterium]